MSETDRTIQYVLDGMEEKEKEYIIRSNSIKMVGQNRNLKKFYSITAYSKLLYFQLKYAIDQWNERRKSQKINKNEYRFELCIGILNLISLLIFYLLWIYSNEFPSEELYDQFILNQSQGIIEDIIYLNTSYKCPSEYEPLFNYQWPGTFVGCDCTQNLSSSYIINYTEFTNNFHKEKQCDQIDLNSGCKTLFEITEKNLTLLNDNSYSKPFLLCAKRSQNISLRYNFTYCQLENKTICGSGSFIYCLPPEVECPISDIGFTNNLDYQNLKLKNDPKFGKIFNVSNQLQFYYTKNQSLIPISQVQITETEEICKLNSQNNISPNRTDYYLMKIQRKPCQEQDTQFKTVYRLNEDQFYLANNLQVLNRSLTYFNLNSSVIWTLKIKSYTQIKESCQFGSEEGISDYENFIRKIDLESLKTQRYINQFQIIPILLMIILNFFPSFLENLIVNLLKIFQNQALEKTTKIFYNRILRSLIHTAICIFVYLDSRRQAQYQEYYIDFISLQCIVTELASSIYDFQQIDYSPSFIVYRAIVIYVVQNIFIIYYLYKSLYELCSQYIKQRNNDKNNDKDNGIKINQVAPQQGQSSDSSGNQ